MAHYYDVAAGERTASDAAWAYHTPNRAFTRIAGYVAFYPGLMDGACSTTRWSRPSPEGSTVAGSPPTWSGPFKGGPGTQGW